MTDSFELLTGGITSVYKSIQKIKKLSMSEIGLKGVHAMCIYYLYTTPDGLTAAELCIRCREDKAAISRILSELKSFEMITYQQAAALRKAENTGQKLYLLTRDVPMQVRSLN